MPSQRRRRRLKPRRLSAYPNPYDDPNRFEEATFTDLALSRAAPRCSLEDDYDKETYGKHCRQMAGHCYYMAALNFVRRAETMLRAAGFTSPRWEIIYAFANEMAELSCDASGDQALIRSNVTNLCRELPAAFLPVHYSYQDRFNVAQNTTVPHSRAMREGGWPDMLLESMFEQNDTVTVTVTSLPKWLSETTQHVVEHSNKQVVMVHMKVSPQVQMNTVSKYNAHATALPDNYADLDIVTVFYTAVHAAMRAATAGNKTLLGGTCTFVSGPRENGGHAISWNVCGSDLETLELVLIDSNDRTSIEFSSGVVKTLYRMNEKLVRSGHLGYKLDDIFAVMVA